MQPTDKPPSDLSRRKFLAGLGGRGPHPCWAGLGTSALFSDTENSLGNTITADELDLLVHYEAIYDEVP